MTEREKMLAGNIYDPSDEQLAKRRALAHKLSIQFNATYETDEEARKTILDELMPNRAENTFLQGPVMFDYGDNIYVGENFYANFNFTVLDCCPVHIGDDVMIGPNVAIYTPVHPFRW
ncbi:MAG: sugar O-acetyltransferase, partial [Clostridia bacterium]|nr:sugar O-acetyltransferase [Clostridia bacterium]